MFYLAHQATHDIVEQSHLLAVEMFGADYKQIRYLAQYFSS